MRFRRETVVSSVVFLTFAWAVWQVSQNIWMSVASLIFCFGLYRLAYTHERDEADERARRRVEIGQLIDGGSEIVRILLNEGDKPLTDYEKSVCDKWHDTTVNWLTKESPGDVAIFRLPRTALPITYTNDHRRNGIIQTMKARIAALAEIAARFPR